MGYHIYFKRLKEGAYPSYGNNCLSMVLNEEFRTKTFELSPILSIK